MDAVAQPHGLVDPGIFLDGEGRRGGGVQDAQLRCHHLDLAGLHVGVDGVFAAAFHDAADGDHVFRPQLPGSFVGFGGRVGTEDHLDDFRFVSQIDEDHPAVVPTALDPTRENDLRVDGLGGHGLAVVTATQGAERIQCVEGAFHAQLRRARAASLAEPRCRRHRVGSP